jgi:hypothetical protein
MPRVRWRRDLRTFDLERCFEEPGEQLLIGGGVRASPAEGALSSQALQAAVLVPE